MNKKEIAKLIQGWLDDLNSAGIERDALPKKYREEDIDSFFAGMVFALESVIEQLEK